MRISTHKIFLGFTIIEMMVGLTLSGIILSAVVIAGVALQRSFAAVEAYSISEGDQLRVQDYIAMDCRRSTNATVANGSWVLSGGTYSWVTDPSGPVTLTLTVPNYYDGSGNNVAPSFTPSGSSFAVKYGTGATTQISYYKSGNSFIRQVGTNPTLCTSGTAWTNCAKVIASNVNSFTVLPSDMTTTVRVSITFTPQFTTSDSASASTTVYANTFLRNPAARH
jgi:hypothetical protein